MAKVKKTNPMRLLDQLKIAYEVMEYKVDEDDLAATSTANKVGLPAEQVFKTLVARGNHTGVFLACLPGNREVDLKALAAVSGNKKVELVPLKDVQKLTGYIRGGVSPLATTRNYNLYVDESMHQHERITISAGIRGALLYLIPDDLLKATNAKTGNISK